MSVFESISIKNKSDFEIKEEFVEDFNEYKNLTLKSEESTICVITPEVNVTSDNKVEDGRVSSLYFPIDVDDIKEEFEDINQEIFEYLDKSPIMSEVQDQIITPLMENSNIVTSTGFPNDVLNIEREHSYAKQSTEDASHIINDQSGSSESPTKENLPTKNCLQSQLTDVGHSESQYECSQCIKKFAKSGYLKKHLKIHSGVKPFQCSQCEKRFTYLSHLKIHLNVHSGVKPFQCSQCEKRFTQLGHLKIHLNVHSGVKPFQCSQCEKRFTQLSYLKTHLNVHSGVKPFQCSQCEKRFTQLGHLKTHLYVHSGVKPYQCSQCYKRFTQLCSLKDHLNIHSGVKPFQCSQCDKRFTYSSNFKTHLNVHSGVKPFQCSQCDKRFTHLSTLRKHLIIHSGLKPF